MAIKTIKKAKIETEADLIRIRREIQIMSSVRHPNIIHIYEVFENKEKIKQKKEEQIRTKASLDLISRARVLIRSYASDEIIKKKIADVLTGYRDGSIMLEKMREEIEFLERGFRESQQAQEAKNTGDGNVIS